MKKDIFIYRVLLAIFLISCKKEDAKTEKSLESLNGTWKLATYMKPDGSILLSEPSDVSYVIN